jgi:hypothetical protein
MYCIRRIAIELCYFAALSSRHHRHRTIINHQNAITRHLTDFKIGYWTEDPF